MIHKWEFLQNKLTARHKRRTQTYLSRTKILGKRWNASGKTTSIPNNFSNYFCMRAKDYGEIVEERINGEKIDYSRNRYFSVWMKWKSDLNVSVPIKGKFEWNYLVLRKRIRPDMSLARREPHQKRARSKGSQVKRESDQKKARSKESWFCKNVDKK